MKSVYLNQNLICIESEIKVCDFFLVNFVSHLNLKKAQQFLFLE